MDTISVFRIPGNDSRSTLADNVINAMSKKGLDVIVTDINDINNGNELIDAKDSILMSGRDSKASDLGSFANLLNEFDVPLLGNIYIKSV